MGYKKGGMERGLRRTEVEIIPQSVCFVGWDARSGGIVRLGHIDPLGLEILVENAGLVLDCILGGR